KVGNRWRRRGASGSTPTPIVPGWTDGALSTVLRAAHRGLGPPLPNGWRASPEGPPAANPRLRSATGCPPARQGWPAPLHPAQERRVASAPVDHGTLSVLSQ